MKFCKSGGLYFQCKKILEKMKINEKLFCGFYFQKYGFMYS